MAVSIDHLTSQKVPIDKVWKQTYRENGKNATMLRKVIVWATTAVVVFLILPHGDG